ncbi:FAD/NAD(P)-binding protein [Roseateles flavus]|uniref:FAD/NAD(P)-binding protein n=1 Tax=Roseateles flavus TaxID=3149041 RepID=A0ABV0GG90_9BURK
MRKTDIAVIGGGAACVAFLHHLVTAVDCATAARVRVRIFEPRPRLGPGLAYQGDCAAVLLNRGAQTMSASAHEAGAFAYWLRWKAMNAEDLRPWVASDLGSAYVPRPVFGMFLEDFAVEVRKSALKKGLEVQVVHEEVVAIEKGARFHVQSSEGSITADHVLLAMGSAGSFDAYGLSSAQGYIHNPYPLQPKLPALLKSSNVCIIGTGLTAVDVAVALKKAGYEGRIDMRSRSGRLPCVRGLQVRQHTLQEATRCAVMTLAAKGPGKASLRELLRLLRAELRSEGACWKHLFARHPDAQSRLRSQLTAENQVVPWQLVLASTNEVIEQAWHSLSPVAQHLVLQRFHGDWMCRRAPMPWVNAKLLLDMMDSRQLRILKGGASFTVVPAQGLIACDHLDSETRDHYQTVINATGATRQISSDQDSALLRGLLRDGHAQADWRGGLQVDFATSSLVNAQGVPDPRLRVIGHLTCGTYFFVPSLEMIAKRAQCIAEQIRDDLQRSSAASADYVSEQP